ncbi:DNA-directed RNA polymerase (rpoE), archaeal and eukaryotic form [Thermoplasmatales archaeon BRNA1]|nr:DNA-directed RNA polymerase (rpoE), archaeal and eukaryotic form [Thermoplasmatales archaeon BRNA1]
MYMTTEVQRIVRIPPSRLGENIDEVVGPIACETFEGKLGEDKSIAVLVSDVRTDGAPGRIVHGDGAVYQPVTFKQLVFKPKENELIEGTVVEILSFGAFVRFGPLDALLHVSQIMNDRVDADLANQRLIGKDTGRYLAVGDRVRARITSIELNEKNPDDSKIGLTMRQAGLGKLEWIEEDERKAKKGGDE